MTISRPSELCREHFRRLEIMMYLQYIYSLMLCTVRNQHLFSSSNSIHQYRTRYNNDLHLLIANLKKYKDGPYFTAIKIYNHLSEYIKALTSDLKSFKKTLKGFLCRYSLYSIQEYYNIQKVLLGNFHSYKKLIIYTGCNRRNVQDFGRVFLMLNYTDITQNTYIQS